MGLIPDEIIQQIRDRVDLVELDRALRHPQEGRPQLQGPVSLPRREDPVLQRQPRPPGSFYCFGCQEGGNAITFLMKIENLTFPEAVRTLGRESAGSRSPKTDPASAACPSACATANEVAQACYRAALAAPGNPAPPISRSAASTPTASSASGSASRPIAGTLVAQRLRAQGSRRRSASARDSWPRASSGGHYDRLRGRVTFPIRDARGRDARLRRARARGRPGAQVPEHARDPGLPQARGLLRLSRRRSSRSAAASARWSSRATSI